ncbi:DNA polymerase alpha/epsilon, subunit B [Kalmanozyma brasiliensis GHG001]|uniref:DNA polymerase epsilon subunit B n=1 Tax=Kalmanozyma brasiliensis (strain GHG001) TaxID=1365824 RepID=V5GHE3_KALBG|nr:DNA polymerase alpha/epsilon, subunit B [Kalmanozyma brasiliensis GHG001]EST05432.1 DNA polymerase alpha/epsilon, subunit B [Kalmanozyma brasiliensis GHG001]
MTSVAIAPPPELRRTILRVFTTKHSLQLHSSAISFITSTLAEHGLLEQPLEWEEAIDALAQGVVEGQSDVDPKTPSTSRAATLARNGSAGRGLDDDDSTDPSDVVTAAALEKVYSRLVVADSAAHTNPGVVDDGVHRHPHELTDGELPDPHRYFGVHSAFSQPKLAFDPIRKVFESSASSPTVLPTASTRSLFPRQRYHILKSVISRNENFCPPLAIPTAGSSSSSRNNAADGFMKLTSTKNLLGRQGQRFLLFGMLSTSSDGRYELEDADGTVGLDLENAIPGEGIFTEGSLILVEGEYTQEERIRVFAIGHPPSETRAQARLIHAHTDFLGPPQPPTVASASAPSRAATSAPWRGAMSVKEEAAFQVHEANHSDLCFVIFSDLHLDHPKTMSAFATVLQGYVDAEFIPFALVLCGNFASQQYSSADMVDKYKTGFAALGETLSSFPAVVRTSHIIIVPGPQDPFSTSLVPRPPLPTLLVQPLLSKLKPLHATIHLASNPCRLSYFSQQLVIYRDDTMTRFLRNTVRIKDETHEQEREEREKEERDLKKFLVSTVLDQAHLVPLAQRIRPVLWDHDHALSLYPMPTALVLADAYDRYELTYEGCHVVNPGSFRSGSGFAWSTYYPATRRTEPSELPLN